MRYYILIISSLLLIVYVAAQVMARTAGFRDLVGQQLELRLGLPVKIEDSSVNWRFDLTLINVATLEAKKPNSPALRAKRMFFAWSLSDRMRGGPGLRAVELDRCVMVLRRAEDGKWLPAGFQPLSNVLCKWLEFDLTGSTSLLAQVGAESAGKTGSRQDCPPSQRFPFALRQGEITWWDGGDAARANARGVSVQITPVKLPGRALTHLNLAVDQASCDRGDIIRNLRVELLDAGDREFVLGSDVERQKSPNP